MSFTGHRKTNLFFQERAFSLFSRVHPVAVGLPLEVDCIITKEKFLEWEKDCIQAEIKHGRRYQLKDR